MSFHNYSKHMYGFSTLDAMLPDETRQNNYYNKWMKKYARIFKTSDNFAGIEWDLRCQKALWEIFSSATFFIEAKTNFKMKCFSSYYFCLYYSLFHAIYSSIFLDAESSLSKLLNVTHRNIVNIFISAFANTKDDIMDRNIKDLFQSFKYKREYYSYVTPFNNIFDHQESLELLENTLTACYQLTSFHSMMVAKSYSKNVGKLAKLKRYDEYLEFNKLFEMLFSKIDDLGKNNLDDASKNLKNELIICGFKPSYIALDLDHQFDEFHGYDDFYTDFNEYDLKITDIWAFIVKAIASD